MGRFMGSPCRAENGGESTLMGTLMGALVEAFVGTLVVGSNFAVRVLCALPSPILALQRFREGNQPKVACIKLF